MAVKTYGYRRYRCGCVCSLWPDGTVQGYRDQCFVSHALMTARIQDPRDETKEVSAEWRAIANAHLSANEVTEDELHTEKLRNKEALARAFGDH